MHILEYFVQNQIITHKGCRPLIADSKKHVYARFTLDDEWDGLAVAAVFENSSSEDAVSVPLSADLVEVPPEVLVDGHLSVSLVGLGAEGEKRLPTASMTTPIKVYRAGQLIGIPPEYRTPELWEQLLAIIGLVSDLDTKDKTNLVAAINEVLRRAGSGGSGGIGVDGATFIPRVSEDGILSWTNDQGLPNPESVDIKGKPGATFVPRITGAGVISWSNDQDKENPENVDLVAAVMAALPNGDEVAY